MNKLASDIYENSLTHGFWDFPDPSETTRSLFISQKLALIHSEVSEAVEEHRKHPSHFSVKGPFEEELADIIIRTLDLCGYLGINIESLIVAKHEKNKARPHRHNKRF